MTIKHLSVAGLLLLAGSGNGCMNAGATQPSKPMSAEAFCGTVRDPQFGKAFYCGTSQANLQPVPFPDGSRGYCMVADEGLGLVGYSVTTYNGGAFPVMRQSRASSLTQQLGNASPGYIMCTREQ